MKRSYKNIYRGRYRAIWISSRIRCWNNFRPFLGNNMVWSRAFWPPFYRATFWYFCRCAPSHACLCRRCYGSVLIYISIFVKDKKVHNFKITSVLHCADDVLDQECDMPTVHHHLVNIPNNLDLNSNLDEIIDVSFFYIRTCNCLA